MNLRDLGESAVIRRLRERFLFKEGIGIGDDAAVFNLPHGESAVFCSDLLAENTHFLRSLHPADAVAYKAVAANVSDVGAMGGTPLHFLLSIAAPGDLPVSWLDSFIDGLDRACRDFDIRLLGGDSSSSEQIFIDVSMIGSVPRNRAVLRSGARAGDNVYVTGALGASMLGLELLKAAKLDHPAVKRHLYPTPRHRIGAAVRNSAHAMIDISDGLSTDLAHILEESKVSARIYQRLLPIALDASQADALHGGEEYELIIMAPDLPAEIEGVPVTRIGEIIGSSLEHRTYLIDGNRESVLEPRGWQHF